MPGEVPDKCVQLNISSHKTAVEAMEFMHALLQDDSYNLMDLVCFVCLKHHGEGEDDG